MGPGHSLSPIPLCSVDTGPHPNPTAREIKSECPAQGHGIMSLVIKSESQAPSGGPVYTQRPGPWWIAQTGRVRVAYAMIRSSS